MMQPKTFARRLFTRYGTTMILVLGLGTFGASAQGSAPGGQTPRDGEPTIEKPSFIPECEGMKALPRFSFAFPNYEKSMQQLKGSEIVYYSCSSPPDLVAASFRARLKAAPFRLSEVGWVERKQGIFGTFYNRALSAWTYLWIIPDSSGHGSRAIAAQSFGEAFGCQFTAPGDQPADFGISI
jgi:hypothetical protein